MPASRRLAESHSVTSGMRRSLVWAWRWYSPFPRAPSCSPWTHSSSPVAASSATTARREPAVAYTTPLMTSVTVPVGVGRPVGPFTVMVKTSLLPTVDVVTVTVGVVLAMVTTTEFDVGLAEKLRAGDPQPLLTLRVAAVGQYWGGVGPLSAGSTQGFRSSDLFLVGVNVMVGIHR